MLDQTETNLPSLLDDPSLLQTQAYVNGEWIDGADDLDLRECWPPPSKFSV